MNVKLAVLIFTTAFRGLNLGYTNQSVNAVDREVIAVCSQIHTKHLNTLCGLNVELVNVKPGVV